MASYARPGVTGPRTNILQGAGRLPAQTRGVYPSSKLSNLSKPGSPGSSLMPGGGNLSPVQMKPRLPVKQPLPQLTPDMLRQIAAKRLGM